MGVPSAEPTLQEALSHLWGWVAHHPTRYYKKAHMLSSLPPWNSTQVLSALLESPWVFLWGQLDGGIEWHTLSWSLILFLEAN